jgi:FtsH-binding integral membrane protein
MADSVSLDLSAQHAAQAHQLSRVTAVPWFVWTGVAAASSIAFGLYWDISWHMTIGRDTFWTPAHLLIQFGGILAAITCIYLIFSTTFARDPASRDSSVRIWGFRGPLGAFLTAWGGVTMLTSAPFDNWWHNSFGLDVQILSPPHVVLGLGMMGVGIGCLLLLVAEMNRAEGAARRKLMWLFLYLCGLLIFLHLILVSEYSDPTQMHSAIFYRVLCLGAPVLIIAFARASGYRWGATAIAAIYTLFMLSWEWILPLFPAQPKLGPVYTNVTHMVPIQFPLLILGPAIAIDLLLNRFAGRGKWFRSLILGSAFLAALVAVHWPFGNFMISPLARNWVFGMNYFPYQMPPSFYYQAYQFQHNEATLAAFWLGMGIAWISAIVSARVGLGFGDWLCRIRR